MIQTWCRLQRPALLALLLGCSLLSERVDAASVSVNFCIGLTGNNTVGAGETATQLHPVSGTNWNNCLLANAKGVPATFIANTTGGNSIQLLDDQGNLNAAQLTSSLNSTGGNSNASSVTPTHLTGEAGMMATYLLLGGANETITVSGLGAPFTTYGYKVYLFFDIGMAGASARSLGYTVNDGLNSRTLWAVDSAGDNSDVNDDSVTEWLLATGTSQPAATAGANYAEFPGLSGSSFTVSVATTSRGGISGLQIVANAGPPPTINSFTASPEAVLSGSSATLAWQVSSADTVTITPEIGAVSTSGSTTVTPLSATTYTLTASNAYGTVTGNVSVNISRGPIDVYLLGGQSNMAGQGESSAIPAGQETATGVLFYKSGLLTNDTSASGVTFGPEIGFANRMKQLRPGAKIALIKYAVGGTSLIVDWKPGSNAADSANWGTQFTSFVDTVTAGMAALRTEGYQPRIVGMLWQQGEADARSGLGFSSLTEAVAFYESSLTHFIARVREQFAADIVPAGMRFVQGTVLPYAPAGGTVATLYLDRQAVNAAKLNTDENSGLASAVSNTSTVYCDETITPTNEQIVDGYADTDEVHLSAPGQLTLGQLMAEHMQSLDFSSWATTNGLVNGFAGDDDGDGFSNALEFLLGTSPQSHDSVSVGPISSVASLDTGGGPTDYLVLSFRQNMVRNTAGFSWQAQGSPDLSDWSNADYVPVFVDRTNHGDGTATFRYRTARPAGADPKVFLRLRLQFSN